MTKLFCDSAANLPAELVKKYNITVIPFVYTVNGVRSNTYGERFDAKAYYDGMRAGGLVQTSMINIATFEAYFEKALSAGNDVMYVGLSGGVSGTANAARNAAEELREKYPEREIETVDTLGASLGAGLLVLEAAEKLQNGASVGEVCEYIHGRIPHLCQCFTVADLNHLHRSGRLSAGGAIIGGLLGIRPLLVGNDEGKIVMYDKVRGMKAALANLRKKWEELALDPAETLAISHTDNEADAQNLLDALRAAGFTGKCIMECHEPMTGAHLGPGSVALYFFGTSRQM